MNSVVVERKSVAAVGNILVEEEVLAGSTAVGPVGSIVVEGPHTTVAGGWKTCLFHPGHYYMIVRDMTHWPVVPIQEELPSVPCNPLNGLARGMRG